MFNKKTAFAVLSLIGFLFAVPAWGAVKTFKNDLPQKDWAKYGVNPWVMDTDNDGYTDAWEVKNGFCPTNYNKGIVLDDAFCIKGKIDYKNKIYTAPSVIKENLPREVKPAKSCSGLNNLITKLYTSKGVTKAYGSSYASTDVLSEGISKADLKEADSKYVYELTRDIQGERFLNITKTSPTLPDKIIGKVQIKGISPLGLYLSGDRLLITGNVVYYNNAGQVSSISSEVVVQIFDVKNRAKPIMLRAVLFGSSLMGVRLVGNYAYLVLNYGYLETIYGFEGKISDSDVLPKYLESKTTFTEDSFKVRKNLVSCTGVDYLSTIDESRYFLIVALPLNASGKINSKILVGVGGGKIYFSPSNIYVISPRNGYRTWWTKEMTDIYKYSFKNGVVDLVASQVIPGTVLANLALNEKDDYFYAFTTEGREIDWANVDGVQKNNLYVLDKNMNRVGWYENFAEGKNIHSVRYLGSYAQVSTDDEGSELIRFDLRNPRTPKLLEE